MLTDAQLEAAGRLVLDRRELTLFAGEGIAAREAIRRVGDALRYAALCSSSLRREVLVTAFSGQLTGRGSDRVEELTATGTTT